MKKIINSKKPLISGLVVVFIFGAFVYGYTLGQRGVNIGLSQVLVRNAENGKDSSADFSLYWEAWNKLKEKSVVTPDPQKMIYSSISGMFASLDDPYTSFMTPEENKRFREDIGGEFSGIGVEITEKNKLPTVVAPIAGSPAEKAGLKPNDIIYEVDGQKTSDLGFEETITKIRGTVGSTVKLKIIRGQSADPIEFSVVRENITVKSVEWSYKESAGKKIAVIKIKQFGDDTDKLFEDAISSIKVEKPVAIILDLRNNPGGYLETAVNLGSRFIPDGVIVSEKGKNDSNQEYKARGRADLAGYKTVLLVNGGSASASEILAGALRDRKGSLLVGEKTFGKGSVQELIELSDGSSAKITVAKWYTPKGNQINKEGLSPDYTVTEGDDLTIDTQLNKALGLAAE